MGYRYKANIQWEDADWIPANWQREEQVAFFDQIASTLPGWATSILGLAKQLIASESTTSRDYGYEGPYGDRYVVQHPYGIEVYEGASYEDFDMSPVENVDTKIEALGLGWDDPVYAHYPAPMSPLLEQLDAQLGEIGRKLNLEEGEDADRWNNIIENWKDATGDPASYAQEAGEYLSDFSSYIENDAIPSIYDIKQKWIEELRRLENDAYEERMQKAYNDGAQPFVRYATDVLALSEEAVGAIEQATSTRAEEEIKLYTKALKEASIEADDIAGMTEADSAFLKGAVDDLTEIAKRTHHNDIRAWEARGLQKNDALLAFDRVRSYWTKVVKQLDNLEAVQKINRLANKSHPGTVPNYRYKIGQMVKLKGSGRYGKIIGSKLDGGTGKQVYEVRVNGADRPKQCYVNEIERAE